VTLPPPPLSPQDPVKQFWVVPTSFALSEYFTAYSALPPYHNNNNAFHFSWSLVVTNKKLHSIYDVSLDPIQPPNSPAPFGRVYDNIAASLFGFVCQVAAISWAEHSTRVLFNLTIPMRYQAIMRPEAARKHPRLPNFAINMILIVKRSDLTKIFGNVRPSFVGDETITYDSRGNNSIFEAWQRFKDFLFTQILDESEKYCRGMENERLDEGPYEGGHAAVYILAQTEMPVRLKDFIISSYLNTHGIFANNARQ
jgi:hypothetical protein